MSSNMTASTEKTEPQSSQCSHTTPRASVRPWTLPSFAVNLWLFTESDFATFVFPDTAFGIFAALSGKAMTTNPTPDLLAIISKVPKVLLWNWLNLLIFDLSNQRHPESVIEDTINKPWRPVPSGRMTVAQTRRLLLLSVPFVLVINYFLGSWEETALLFSLTWMYNDLGGGDEDFVTRNLIIAIAFSQYNKGAMRVASGCGFDVPPNAWQWLAITSGVILTTMHVQDMKDQEGDRAKGRRSAPLTIGDGAARWTIAIPTAFWSFACPAFWGLGLLGYVIPVSIGLLIVFRILALRNFKADKRTWWLWTFWTAIIWMLPLCKEYSVFTRFFQQMIS